MKSVLFQGHFPKQSIFSVEGLSEMEFNIEWHEKLDSTNTCMRIRFFQGERIGDGHIVAAREQTAGRGRQDRRWVSSPNTSLCFSLFLEAATDLIRIPSLTMASALAIVDLLEAKDIRAAPKWPNDVLVGYRKICGILSERVERAEAPRTGIIVGIGLNVNMSNEEAKAIDRPATSIRMETGLEYDPPQLLNDLLPHLDKWIKLWESGGFLAIREVWTSKAGPIGKPLSVHDGDRRKSGTLAGFGEHGELLLATEDGLETIWSGDVT